VTRDQVVFQGKTVHVDHPVILENPDPLDQKDLKDKWVKKVKKGQLEIPENQVNFTANGNRLLGRGVKIFKNL